MQRRISWKVLGLLGATAVIATGLSVTKSAPAADHKDSPATKADPASDINDVYSWMDGNNLVLAMTVFPFADATAKFSDSTQYVFHLTSGDKFGVTKETTNVICTFDATQKASCWVGSDDYVTGDASKTTGITSAKNTKVFAGPVKDPFFFNLVGFNDAVATVTAAKGGLTFDAANCSALNTGTQSAILNTLKEPTSSSNAAKTMEDDFKTAQGLGIVVSIDKALVTKGGAFVSVWGSTNK